MRGFAKVGEEDDLGCVGRIKDKGGPVIDGCDQLAKAYKKQSHLEGCVRAVCKAIVITIPLFKLFVRWSLCKQALP